jgi:hypothetical protein
MAVVLTMTVRTWAALDAGLAFFRQTPPEVEPGQRLARHCRYLHSALRRTGLRAGYVRIGAVAPGRSLLRLHVRGQLSPGQALEMELPRPVARSLARACLTIIEVQTDNELGQLLDHEAEELQAARTFLSELRRQSLPTLVPEKRGRGLIAWDDARQEYSFTAHVAWRVQEHYLRVGASPN